MKLLSEIMDLYNLYDKPESLYGYDKAYDTIPVLAWNKITSGHSNFTDQQITELKKKEYLWAQNPEFAYNYAYNIIKGKWPPGEDAIAKDPQWAYYYSLYVVCKRWPPGEDVIEKDPIWKYSYASCVALDPNFWNKKQQGLIK